MTVLPTNLPASMRPDLIANPQVRKLLEEDLALRERRSVVREELRKVVNAKGKCLAVHLPKLNNHTSVLTASIDALSLKKDELFTEINNLKLLLGELSHVRQMLQVQEFDHSALTREMRDAELALQDEVRELDRLRDERTARSSRLRFATMELVDKELELIDAELAKSKGGCGVLRGKRAMVERAKQELHGLSAFDRRIAAQSRRVESLRAEIGAKSAACSSNEESRAALYKQLQVLHEKCPAEQKQRLNALHNELAQVQRELTEALDLRKEKRPVIDEMDALRQTRQTHTAELQKIEDGLAVLRRELPCRPFTYQPRMKSVLVGKGGATLEQLQVDFGVAICIDGVSAGTGFVVGDEADVAAALAAILEILAAAEASNHEIVLQYDAALRKRLVGSGGANVRGIERESGASVTIKNGTVTLRGTPECVAAAEALVLQFLGNQHRAELQFDPEDLPHVIGKNGSVIKRIEEETGVRNLIVDRGTHRIIATGEEANVEAAIRRYTELLEDVRRATLVVHCNDVVLRQLVGPKGRRLWDIAGATGVLVRVNDGTITVRGSTQAVEAARVKLHDLQRTEVRVPLDPMLIQMVTTALVRVHNTSADEEGKHISKQQVLEKKDDDDEEGGDDDDDDEETEGGSFSASVTPLELIQRASQCEYMTPIRSEGILLLRGKQEHVNQAHAMLKDFALRYSPCVITVSFPEIIFASLTRPRGSEPSVVNQLTKSGSPLLRVQLKRNEEVAIISSPLVEDVEKAANSLREFVDARSLSVRRIRDLSQQRIAALIGVGGRELEERTGSRILVRRAAGEVQVFRDDGDEAALDEAVAAITAAGEGNNSDGSGVVKGKGGSEEGSLRRRRRRR